MRGCVLLMLAACSSPTAGAVDAAADLDAAHPGSWADYGLGATYEPDGIHVRFQVWSARATRIEVWLYVRPTVAAAVMSVPLEPAGGDLWRARVDASALTGKTIYYGLRAWGPNWPYDPSWTPGSEAGFVADVDDQGNRFDPNKLLIDPYARELSHDPTGPANTDYGIFGVGADHRAIDSAPLAPKGIVLPDLGAAPRPAPARGLRDEIIYEVHLRGLTRGDPDATCAGTYAAAAARADYLARLGITAIELLPLAETNNDANDLEVGTAGDNYWGYATLAYFAPDRRYACDQSPGGPTRELRAMVDAFHAAGLKVLVDVVYNHTAEGGGGSLLSLRGLDNADYYELADDPTRFVDNTGIGANTNTVSPAFRQLVLDSLDYWHRELGVDGFRYDLASVLGNRCATGCFQFDPDDPQGLLRRIPAELPDAYHIAEPWGIGAGTYQVGHYPPGWAEWNDGFRDDLRRDQNRLGTDDVTPGWLANRIAGTWNRFGATGRPPWASIDYLVSHDGFTLFDLHACNDKNNDQPWPYGPSHGGDDNNLSWDHHGDPVQQRQAVRTSLALMMLSAGVPMMTGGDELLRSQHCNNNAYNLDSDQNWLDWSADADERSLRTFVSRLTAFRTAHPALRPDGYWQPDQVTWLRAGGAVADAAYLDDDQQQFLGWLLDGTALGDGARSIYAAYNGSADTVVVQLPAPAAGHAWFRVADTSAWMEPYANIDPAGSEYRMHQRRYDLGGRALALFLERPAAP